MRCDDTIPYTPRSPKTMASPVQAHQPTSYGAPTYMETTHINGHTPDLEIGHDNPTLGHETSNGLQQSNQLMEEVLQGEEPQAPTAKTDSPDAETEKAKTRRSIETGFAVNVQNLLLVRQRIVSFGPRYIQGSPLYTIENMQTVYDEAQESVNTFNIAKQANDQSTDAINTVFDNLQVDATRTKNLFIWCGVSDKAIKRMESLNHLIQGTRVIPIDKDSTDDHASTAHTSRAQQLQHVRELVLFLDDYPQFLPPPDITAAAWKIRYEAMEAAQLVQFTTSSELKEARLKRNIAIYKKTTGVVEIGLGAKKTVLGIFGYNSPEYAMVKSIPFRRIPGWENL